MPADLTHVWNNQPFPPEAERLVLPDGRELQDAVIWEGFCQTQLNLDPAALWETFNTIPSWPDDQPIPFREAGDEPHWITGAHPALHYRGHALKRSKIWCQTDYRSGLRRYGYTGWSHAISYATHAIEHVPGAQELADRINAGLMASGQQAHNHFIVTRYDTGEDHIGFHSDKDGDYAEDSYFLILKLGEARAFAFREVPVQPGQEPKPFFSRILSAGTAIFVRAKGAEAANDLVQHAVPPMDGPVGPSGSVVSRCIETVRPWVDVERGIQKAQAAQARRQAGKGRSASRGALSPKKPGQPGPMTPELRTQIRTELGSGRSVAEVAASLGQSPGRVAAVKAHMTRNSS